LKRAAALLATAALLLSVSGCYVVKQGSYLLRHQLQSRGADRLLASKGTPEDLRRFLLLVEEVRGFAAGTIGLKRNRSYTRYVELQKSYLIDVVSASKKDRFEPYLWRYLFFGSFPYKGFYERRDAEREAGRLERRDLDVLVRPADAYSTLGFFRDPLYSFMKDYSLYALASLIIHEQTHATLFIKDQVQFNEEMATFVGREGTLQFIREKVGAGSDYYRKVVRYLEDEEALFRLFRELHGRLEAGYTGPGDRGRKLAGKERVIGEFSEAFTRDYERTFHTDAFRGLFDRMPLNNASILSFIQYTGDLSLFERLYERMGRDLKRTVEFLKTIPRDAPDPKEAIRRYLEAGP
jgi:predicted aminopeptidase